jgi:hypothetical protein
VALDYLLATTQAEISWLREFAGSVRSGRLQWRQGDPTARCGANTRK